MQTEENRPAGSRDLPAPSYTTTLYLEISSKEPSTDVEIRPTSTAV